MHVKEVSDIVPPKEGGPAMYLFDLDGNLIEGYDQLESNSSYVVAGIQGFRSYKDDE